MKRETMIEEIEFLLGCDVGEHAILTATGHTHNPRSLQRTLQRAGRNDLIPRIFQWQAECDQQNRRTT